MKIQFMNLMKWNSVAISEYKADKNNSDVTQKQRQTILIFELPTRPEDD